MFLHGSKMTFYYSTHQLKHQSPIYNIPFSGLQKFNIFECISSDQQNLHIRFNLFTFAKNLIYGGI